MPEPWIPVAGERIAGQYEVEGKLGQGSAGVVLAARHIRTGGAVAIKWLLPSGSAETVQRFITEAKVIARVEHPSVIKIHDFGEDRGTPFIVMERLRGESLRARIDRGGPLSEPDAIARLLPAMRGVAEAHREGVVHRDLKPDNIFLCTSKDGRTLPSKVLDFGIAKLFEESGDPLTGTGVMMGTPHYMSPEQLKSPRNIDVRFDVYALGVVLFEALSGTCPFNADGLYTLIAKIVTSETPRLSARVPSVSPAIDAAVSRAMSRDLSTRFASVDQLIEALEGAAIAPSSTRERAKRVIPPTAIGPARREVGSEDPTPAPLPFAPPAAFRPPAPREEEDTGERVRRVDIPPAPPPPRSMPIDVLRATDPGYAASAPRRAFEATLVLPASEPPPRPTDPDPLDWDNAPPTDLEPTNAPGSRPPPAGPEPVVRTARTVVLGEPKR